MRKVFWRSWSCLEAEFELNRIKEIPEIQLQWINAHTQQNITSQDIWLTTNGYDWKPVNCPKITWYAESFVYLPNEYNNYANNKWNHRFHFNPNYSSQKNSSLLNIACWWRREKQAYAEIMAHKKPTHMFGMVQGKKPDKKICPADFGFFRNKVVQQLRNKSFYYYGTNWPADPNYRGEIYINGKRSSPQKFNDARLLLKDAKFVWSIENCHDEQYSKNYMTEKIFHGFLSGSVPIYAGACNIHEMISPDLFIDIRKFSYDIDAIVNFCEKMSDIEYKGYQERIAAFLDGPADKFSCDYRFIEIDKCLQHLV